VISEGQKKLSIVKPIQVTDAILISTDVAETDYAAWNSGTTYAVGDRVILTSTHKVYESIQASNTNKNPTTQPLWWIEVSPTNRWKCLDTSNTTQTVSAGTSMTYTFRPGVAVNCVAVLNVINATSVTVSVTDPVYGVVYDETFDFTYLPAASNWWAWFFGQKSQPSQSISLDLPSFPNADVTVELNGIAGLAVGTIVFGQQLDFGLGIKYGARVGIQDYSRKEANDFGDTVLLPRAFAKRANFDLFMQSHEVDPFQSFLASVRATPVLWVGSSDYEATVIYGFYKTFDILINYPTHADCELEIEGMT